MSVIEGYRANLAEAQRELEIAQTVKDEFKARDMIVWGRTKKGYEGWLCKGEAADLAFSACALAKSNVDHWGTLLNDALRSEAVTQQDRRLPPEREESPPMTPEEAERRKGDVNAGFEDWQARQAPEV